MDRLLGAPNPGLPYPSGASGWPTGANFTIFATQAPGAELSLFNEIDAQRASALIPFDPSANRTYCYWHLFLPGVEAGQIYAYRVHGPDHTGNGQRFDGATVLIDPYVPIVAIPRSACRCC